MVFVVLFYALPASALFSPTIEFVNRGRELKFGHRVSRSHIIGLLLSYKMSIWNVFRRNSVDVKVSRTIAEVSRSLFFAIESGFRIKAEMTIAWEC